MLIRSTKEGWKHSSCKYFAPSLLWSYVVSKAMWMACFKDPAFAEFRVTLDAKMKRIQSLAWDRNEKEESRAPYL